MARSRKKTKVTGVTTCESERQDKQAWHRKFRRITKELLGEFINIPSDEVEAEDFIDPAVREVSNLWDFGKDGKQYYGDLEEETVEKLDRK